MAEDRMLSDEILLGIINSKSGGGGGGGTDDYNDLKNQPQIGGNTLIGNKSASDLGLVAEEAGKGLSTNDYTNADKAIVGGVTAALAGKQDNLTAGDYITFENDEISVNRFVLDGGEYTYDIYSKSTQTHVVVDKYDSNETLVSTREYYMNDLSPAVEVDGLFTLYAYGGPWTCTLLVASKDHAAGYAFSSQFNEYTHHTEIFELPPEESPNDLIIRSELDAEIDAIKDGTSIDSFADVESALADKQDKTDNSLETEAKAIVGAINEHEGDIDSLKSGLTNLSEEVNGDATTYPYADVITIPDAVPANVADCSVKIEPVQDLHGQSAPYVGGAGRQKLPLVLSDIKASNTDGTWNGNVYTINGDTIEVLVDSDNNVLGFKINKTHKVQISFNIFDNKSYVFDGSYDFVGESVLTNGELAYTYTFDKASINVTNPNGVTQAVDDNLNHAHIYIWAAKTYTNQIVTPMVCLSSETDKSFAPYTNICPISGHTEASVQRDGKNLCDKGEGNVYNGGKLIPVSAGDKIYCYGEWVSDNKSFYGAIFSTPTETSKGNKIAILDDFYTGVSKEMTISTNGYFGVCFDTSVESYTVSKMMISRTPIASASDYVPYQGKTYTIALGDTIYGGTVDFDSGVMTVDMAIKDLGDLTWTLQPTQDANKKRLYCSDLSPAAKSVQAEIISDAICSCYGTVTFGQTFRCYTGIGVSGTYVVAYDANYTDATVFTTDMTGQKICYELATPTTIQLTPQQIQLLKGTNTLTASTGQISVTANGVSGSIGSVQTQANNTDEALAGLAADIAEQLPTAPTTDGAYVLTVTVADGTPTYSWVSGS